MSYTFVNKIKSFVDTTVDTAALEPRGFQPCQRCHAKKGIPLCVRVIRRGCACMYIYISCLHIIIIIIYHSWRGFPCQHRRQRKAKKLLTNVQLIENMIFACKQKRISTFAI